MFTGHRIIPIDDRKKLAFSLLDAVKELVGRGVREFIAGGALGFDTLAAECVIAMRRAYPDIKLKLYLPCRDQHARWNARDVERYMRVLENADEILYISENYSPGCMHKRNRAMVDASDICIAYVTRQSGGSAYTISYAEQNGLEIINLGK